jgi:hypothetical protein
VQLFDTLLELEDILVARLYIGQGLLRYFGLHKNLFFESSKKKVVRTRLVSLIFSGRFLFALKWCQKSPNQSIEKIFEFLRQISENASRTLLFLSESCFL